MSPPVYESLIGNNSNNEATLQNVNIKKFNFAGFSAFAFKFLKLDWDINQNASYNNFNFTSNLRQFPETENEGFPFSSDYDFQKFSATTKINSKLNFGSIKFSWGLVADFVGLATKENKNTSLALNDSFFFLQPSFSIKYKMNSKWNAGAGYFQNNKVSDFSELYTSVILTRYNSLVQNPLFINQIKTQSLFAHLNYNDILNSLLCSLIINLNNSNSDVTFSTELSNDGFIVTEVIKKPNLVTSYDFTLNVTKGFLGSFKSDLSYSYNYTQNELFFNNQFLDAKNQRHRINFGLSWDNGGWFSLEYKAKFNFGTSKLPNNKIDNTVFFQTTNLDFYTSPSTRLNFGLESSKTKTSAIRDIDNNTLFNTSFYYKPSKKVNLSASLLNIFDTPYFTTSNGNANFVNIYQFYLRPRQLTVGFTYSL